MGGFCLVVEFHRKGSAPAACAAGLFSYMTQFEIECRCGGHSVTKKFKTILQLLLAKPKLWKN